MSSVFRSGVGSEFARLHPNLQRRFDVGLDNGLAFKGTGIMTSVYRGPWWTVPFLKLGSFRNILLPDHGGQIPFTIENYPYRDPFGRETVTFVRSYNFHGKSRQFDATMINDQGRVIDYLGTHQHLAVPLSFSVLEDGSLELRSGRMWFIEHRIRFKVPKLFHGEALLTERWDEEQERFRVDLEVRNPYFGMLFGYSGWFTGEWVELNANSGASIPAHLVPRRHEKRSAPL